MGLQMASMPKDMDAGMTDYDGLAQRIKAWGLELVRGQDGDKTLPPRERLLGVARRLVSAAERDPADDPGLEHRVAEESYKAAPASL